MRVSVSRAAPRRGALCCGLLSVAIGGSCTGSFDAAPDLLPPPIEIESLTSDHGEALYERGYGNHGIGLHDDELAVPLALRLPGAGRTKDRVDTLVSLIDIMPTLCVYARLDCGGGLAGRSLVAPRSQSTPHYVVSESVRGAPESRTIRNSHLKLIWQPRAPQEKRGHREYSLFDMKASQPPSTGRA